MVTSRGTGHKPRAPTTSWVGCTGALFVDLTTCCLESILFSVALGAHRIGRRMNYYFEIGALYKDRRGSARTRRLAISARGASRAARARLWFDATGSVSGVFWRDRIARASTNERNWSGHLGTRSNHGFGNLPYVCRARVCAHGCASSQGCPRGSFGGRAETWPFDHPRSASMCVSTGMA